MSKVVDFKCLRIQVELDKFIKTNTLPHALFEGMFSVEDIEHCYDEFNLEHKRAATKLIKTYRQSIRENETSLYETFKTDYYKTIETLRTRSEIFRFDNILSKYRITINPVTAIYYEAREALRKKDKDSTYIKWIHSLVTDKEFNNLLQDALYHDVRILEKIINRYYWPLKNASKDIPMEIYHARRIIKDFMSHLTFFQNSLDWDLYD